jgi:N-acetylmuramoyl-L-alanine amidase CwlA
MIIKTNLANRKNYGGTRSLSDIKYIIMHYTANDGDTDENNGNYFHNNSVGASAHYFVDGDSVTRSVPDDCVAWHCGASSYKHASCRNSNSIGVELCDERKNGVLYPTPATIANALELVEYLMDKYKVPKENVIRHYDVTGKLCPAYWCGNSKNNDLWKTEFWNKLKCDTDGEKPKGETASPKPETTIREDAAVRYRVQTGAFSLKASAYEKMKAVKAAGFETFLIQVGNLWKVQAGSFENRENAENLAAELRAAGFSAFVATVTESEAASIKVGCTVRVQYGAKDYTGNRLADFVYGRNHIVKSISGNRVVITFNGIVVAAVHKDNLILQ